MQDPCLTPIPYPFPQNGGRGIYRNWVFAACKARCEHPISVSKSPPLEGRGQGVG